MSDFRIKFRGVRGSYPVVNKDFLEYGGNTSCVEIHVGGHLIILDAGTGLINVGDDLTKEYIIFFLLNIFYTSHPLMKYILDLV